MKLINIFLVIITFGKQNKFMIDYITTIGTKIYVPDGWDEWSEEVKDCVLFHENVHVEQYKKEGLKYVFKYLFWPLPALRARARLEYEVEAYAKDIVYSYRKYGTPLFGYRCYKIISNLTGPEYFWTYTNRAYVSKRLFSKILEELKTEKEK